MNYSLRPALSDHNYINTWLAIINSDFFSLEAQGSVIHFKFIWLLGHRLFSNWVREQNWDVLEIVLYLDWLRLIFIVCDWCRGILSFDRLLNSHWLYWLLNSRFSDLGDGICWFLILINWLKLLDLYLLRWCRPFGSSRRNRLRFLWLCWTELDYLFTLFILLLLHCLWNILLNYLFLHNHCFLLGHDSLRRWNLNIIDSFVGFVDRCLNIVYLFFKFNF